MSTGESQDGEFQQFLANGEVRLQKCGKCGTMRFPTRWICPECLSEEYEWAPVAGRAEVECLTWYMEPFDPRFTEVPYNVALVRLAEGPRLVANVVGVSFGELAVGQQVSPVIEQGTGGRFVLNFRPAAGAGA